MVNNAAALAPAFKRGNDFLEGYIAATGVEAGAAAAVFAGPAVATNLAARGLGWYYGLFGTGSGVVLGQFDEYTNYISAAKSMGANALNASNSTYNFFLSRGEWWTLNQSFLNASIFRGQQFFMSSPVLGAEGNYWMELYYLSSRGIGPEQWQMVPVPY